MGPGSLPITTDDTSAGKAQVTVYTTHTKKTSASPLSPAQGGQIQMPAQT